MILITGATGQLGSAVLEHLLETEAPENLGALVRNEQKAAHWKERGVAVRVADFNDPASLAQALTGVEKLLLVSLNSPDVLRDHQRVVDAAKQAGVGHFLYTSGALRPQPHSELGPLADAYQPTEDCIKASGLTYTIFQNGLYAETLPFFMGEQAVETGISFPAGEGRASFAKRAEMGIAIANVLTSAGHENRTYPLTGEQSYTFPELARMLTALASKEVAYTSPDPDHFEAQLASYGVGKEDIDSAALLARIIKNNEYDVVDPTLSRLLGYPATPVQAYLKEAYFTPAN